MVFKIDDNYYEGELTFTITEEPTTVFDEQTQEQIPQMQTVVYGTLLLEDFLTDMHFIRSDTFRFDKVHVERITIGTRDSGIAYDFSCTDFRIDNEKLKTMLIDNKQKGGLQDDREKSRNTTT